MFSNGKGDVPWGLFKKNPKKNVPVNELVGGSPLIHIQYRISRHTFNIF